MNDGTLTFADQLRYEGILCKGFGILPKYVMLDTDLTLEAKALYAYFCSLAGNGQTAFPGRDTILHDLGISKNTFYKHFALVLEHGYITSRQTRKGDGFGGNIYTIMSNPKKFAEPPVNESDAGTYSKISFHGVKSMGYGIVPRSVMIDTRLDIKAKGIYAYFCAYSGAGCAFPERDNILYHLSVGKDAYYRYYRQLTSCGYIESRQRKCGHFSVNDYYLIDNPNPEETCYDVSGDAKQNAEQSPCPDSWDTGFCDSGTEILLPEEESPCTVFWDTGFWDTGFCDTNITNITITSINNNKLHTPSFTRMRARESEGLNRGDMIYSVEHEIREYGGLPYTYQDEPDKAEAAVSLILFREANPDELERDAYELLLRALTDMVSSSVTMTLRGSHVTAAKVIERVNFSLEIDDSCISLWNVGEQALRDFIRGVTSVKVSNYLAYMKSCIWSALYTHRLGDTAAVLREFGKL